ncbi:MAG TPA: terminase small subunit [Flavipsychrobacter sp.]
MNIKQHKFVTEYLRDGNAMVAYWRAYNVKNPNGKAAESAANRLLRHPEIKAAIDESQSRIRNEVEREVAARRVEEVFSIEEKRVLLKKIATGQMMVEQYYKGKDCNMCTQYVRPSIWHVLSAIKEDSRLAGHYPTQQPSEAVSMRHLERHESPQQLRGARSLSPLKETSTRQQNTTTDKTEDINNESPLKGDRGTTREEHSQQLSEPVSMRHLERHESSQQKTTKQNTTTDKTEHMDNESPRNLSRSEREGDRGTTREEHSQHPSEAVSLRHFERHESSQQLSGAPSLSPLKETSIRQQKTTTDGESSPLGAGGDTSPDTITHDELMRLLYPNKYKLKQHYQEKRTT